MTHVVKSVELPNRVTLQYVEQGDSAGTPVILLHGVTDSWHSFEPVLPHLPSSIHAIALTQRGHGDSARPEAGYHPRDFGRDVASFMDALELKSAVIVGHSMGSYVAQCFAIDYPERTSGLVLVGSFINCRDNPGIVEFWDSAVSKLTDPVDPNFVREFQESTLARAVPQAFLDRVVQESLKVPARVWRAAFEGLLAADFSVGLGKIKAPTLILWGDRDGYFPRGDQDALASAIAGSQFTVYANVGHALHWEEPERFAADLMGFVRGIGNAAPL